MATDAILVLERLTCGRESDRSGGSEPYIWPVLIWVDDDTLITPGVVGVTSPPVIHAQDVIKEDMRGGQVADISEGVGVLRVRLDDNQTVRTLILVVALWEKDDTPWYAARLGYGAFVSALRDSLGDITTLMALSQPTTPEERQATIDAIKATVNSMVHSAIRNGLSAWQKARYLAGLLNLDDIVGSSFSAFPQLTSQPFTLEFASAENPPRNLYSIEGRLQAVPVAVDRCGEQARAVRDAQEVVNNLEEEIARLQAMLHGEPDPGEPQLPKSTIMAEIRQIREVDLPPAEAALAAARAALAECRSRQIATFPDLASQQASF